MRALVTGATGYVGSRLVPALLEAGFEVLAGARKVDKLKRFDWSDRVTGVELDVMDEESTGKAMSDYGQVDVAYYLVHAIGEGDFAETDKRSAKIFATQAQAAKVGKIVYLGGFVPEGEHLSEHLASRGEVGRQLAESGIDLVWLRAAVIIGAGSTSYELIRSLADRLPVVPIPSWMNHDVTPIAVDDVLRYLVAGGQPEVPAGAYDITGPDTLPYKELFREYIRAAGLHRALLPAPGVSTKIAGAIIGRITPLPDELAEDLIGSMQNTMTSEKHQIRKFVADPAGGLTSVKDAMRRAQPRPGTGREDLPEVSTTPDPLRLAATDPSWAGGDRYQTKRERVVDASAAKVWAVIETVGGVNGFFSWPLAWKVRAQLDKWVGGPGAAQQRAHQGRLTVGDNIEFLEVVEVTPGHDVTFSTDRWSPGTGSLEVWVEPAGSRSTVHLRARWLPRGLNGRLYWLGLKPFHFIIFPAMLRRIASLAEHPTEPTQLPAAV